MVKRSRLEGGVSMVEMLTALVVGSLTLAMGLPGVLHWVRDAQQSSQANAFLADLALARTESLRRGARVVLCVSTSGENCSAGGTWQQGRIVFVDVNNNAQRDAGEPILLVVEAGPGNWVLRGNANVARYVSYHPSGKTRLTSGAFQAGTITVCQQSDTVVRASQIVISASGRPRSQRTQLDQCL